MEPSTHGEQQAFRQRQMVHEAGSVIGPDIYWPLLCNVLSNEPVAIWHNEETTWQLRVVGAPGCGKVSDEQNQQD
jgi:hypothetical protein